MPEDTDEALATLAALARVPKGEYVRDLVMCHVHGALEVVRLRQSSAQKGAAMAPE